jgi:hypothetical protein
MMRTHTTILEGVPAIALLGAALAVLPSCGSTAPSAQRTFQTPEEAVQALDASVAKGDLAELVRIFGADVQQLLDTSDAVAARQRREVFTVAMTEGWRLVDHDEGKSLVVGNEDWPFPVPLVNDRSGWRFDTTAGIEEVLARRIGRNELAVVGVCRRYVSAQRLYASEGRDGKPAGAFAQRIRSDPDRQNGLYWPTAPGTARSPLGDLLADASPGPGTGDSTSPAPFNGYYYRVLTGQGPSAPGGSRSFIVDGAMSGGFALVAWPAQYDVTGIMTFLVSHDGVVHEKDLGTATDAVVAQMTLYDPDATWRAVP